MVGLKVKQNDKWKRTPDEVQGRRVSVAPYGRAEANINGQMKTMLKATVERRYKDSSGQWKSSNSFGRNEVPLVRWCLDQAFSAMIQEKSTSDTAEEEGVN